MTSDAVRVTYLLTTRNRARFVERTLANVREFWTPEDEVIVVDAASTDDTAAVVEANRDMVRSFISEPDTGEAHGFNKGILASRGRYIKLLNDDDHTYAQGMRQAIDTLEGHPELDAILCGGESTRFDPESGQETFLTYNFIPPGGQLAGDVENMARYPTCGLGLILTRKVIPRLGLLETTFGAVDFEVIMRLITLKANLKYAHIKLYRHIEHAHSIQRILPIMMRDSARAFIRNGRWDLAARRHTPAALAEALGTKGLPAGEPLTRLMRYGERMRQSRLRCLLGPAATVADLMYWLVQRLPGGKDANGSAAALSNPGEWDGSLR